FADVSAWEELARSGGIDGLEQCLAVAGTFASHGEDWIAEALALMLRLVRREAHHFREWDQRCQSDAFVQHIQFRAVTLGVTSLAGTAECRLRQLARPYLQLRWRTLNESPALVRLLPGHEDWVRSVAVSPDGRRIVSGSKDQTVAVWDLESGS